MKNDKDNLIAIFKRNIAMHANGPVLSSDQFSSEVKTEMNGFIRGLQRGLEIVELTEPATTQIAALEQDVHDLAVTQIDYQKLTHEQREQIAALRSALESVESRMGEILEDELYGLCGSAGRQEIAEEGFKAAITALKTALEAK